MQRSLIVGLALVAVLITPVAVEAMPVIPVPRPDPGIMTDPICIFNHSDPSCFSTTTPATPVGRHHQIRRNHHRWSGLGSSRSVDPSFSVLVPDRSGDHWWVVTPRGQNLDPYFFVSPIYSPSFSS